MILFLSIILVFRLIRALYTKRFKRYFGATIVEVATMMTSLLNPISSYGCASKTLYNRHVKLVSVCGGRNFQFYTQGIVIYIFSIYQKSKFFLCSKNSHSALYNSIVFIFRYVCKSILFIFRYICKRYI